MDDAAKAEILLSMPSKMAGNSSRAFLYTYINVKCPSKSSMILPPTATWGTTNDVVNLWDGGVGKAGENQMCWSGGWARVRWGRMRRGWSIGGGMGDMLVV